MSELPCTLQSNLSSELIGAFAEIRKWERGDEGITRSIQMTIKERLSTICGEEIPEKEENLKAIKKQTQELEKKILAYLSSQINPDELIGFFRFGVKQGKLVQSSLFQELFELYSLRYGNIAAEEMKNIMSDLKNEGIYSLNIEYGRNKQGDDLFIQKIWLRKMENEK